MAASVGERMRVSAMRAGQPEALMARCAVCRRRRRRCTRRRISLINLKEWKANKKEEGMRGTYRYASGDSVTHTHHAQGGSAREGAARISLSLSMFFANGFSQCSLPHCCAVLPTGLR